MCIYFHDKTDLSLSEQERCRSACVLVHSILLLAAGIVNYLNFKTLSTSVVPIVASYRKLVAVAKNRRHSIETFHYRLSDLPYGSECFLNIWLICGWLGSSNRSNSILHLFSTYFKFNS